MNVRGNRSLLSGLALGAGAIVATAVLMGQSASQPVRNAPEYFVTGAGDAAHLWVREGTTLRVVGHGECKDCPIDHTDHGHEEGDGHDH